MASPGRAASRRKARESERAARYETASMSGWCEVEADLPLIRRQLREALLDAVGSRRRGPLSTYSYTGIEAEKHLAILIEATTEEQFLDAYREALAKLSDRGGFVVTATADYRPPS